MRTPITTGGRGDCHGSVRASRNGMMVALGQEGVDTGGPVLYDPMLRGFYGDGSGSLTVPGIGVHIEINDCIVRSIVRGDAENPGII